MQSLAPEVSVFRPTKRQALAKATYHRRVANNPLISDIASPSKAHIEKYSGVRDCSAWVAQDGFLEWFLNKESGKDLLESGVEAAIQEVLLILDAPSDGEKGSPKPSDKINAAKLLLEYAGYAPTKKAEVDVKERKVQEMSEEELNKMLSKALAEREEITRELSALSRG